MIELKLNGESKQYQDEISLQQLVEQEIGGGAHLAVAVDGRVVPRDSWEKLILQGAEEIEIVQPIQGG